MKSKKPGQMLFAGDFNYGREMEKCFAYAYSGRQAKVFMMRQLARDHGVNYSIVAGIFNGDKNNFEISVDPKWRSKHAL